MVGRRRKRVGTLDKGKCRRSIERLRFCVTRVKGKGNVDSLLDHGTQDFWRQCPDLTRKDELPGLFPS